MKRAALSGARGFIGRALVGAHEAAGGEFVALARAPSGELVAPATVRAFDALVHLAFPTSAAERRRDPEGVERVVLRDAERVVILAQAHGARHIVLASSGKIFGAAAPLPIEDDTPPAPTTQLGRLKLACEARVRARAGAGDAPVAVTALRIFNVYGPDQPAEFFFPTLRAGLETGVLRLGELDHSRDWIHVSDVVSAVFTALAHPPPSGAFRALNVATGRPASARAILATLRAHGHAVPEPEIDAARLRPGEAADEFALADGLRALGWAPEVALEDGLRALFAPARVH